MILAVSPNVALDRVHVVRGFQPGRQSRALLRFLQPGGSGVHAAEVIQALGGASLAMGLTGGHTGELWKVEAARRGLAFDMVPVAAETRESFCLVDLDLGSVVESVEEGPVVGADCLPALLGRIEHQLPQAQMLIISGSLPPGMPRDTYAQIMELARRQRIPTIADLHGEHLSQALRNGAWLIKPSLAEFEELMGEAVNAMPERAHACLRLYRESGVRIALSMSEDGLLVTGPDGQWWLHPPAAPVHLPDGKGRNVIGCGDALVGALAYEYCRVSDLQAAARLGVAAAHHNLGTLGVPEIDADATRQLAASVGIEVL